MGPMGFLVDRVAVGSKKEDVVAVMVDDSRITLRMSQVVLDVRPEELDEIVEMLWQARRLIKT